MKNRFTWIFAGLLLLVCGKVLSAEFPLFKEGKPAAELVMPKQTGKTFRDAVTFFNGELSRCMGTGLPQKSAPSGKLGSITFKLHERPLSEVDAFSITFPDAKTMQIEGTEHSVRFAFNHLLEKHVGIRWFFPPVKGLYGPEINHYSRKRSISVPVESFSDRPAVNLYRTGSWRLGDFAYNWNMNSIIRGGHMMSIDVFPVWKYAPERSWPQEILPVLNGKKFLPPKPAKLPLPRNPYLAKRGYDANFQFCWSNPATVRIAVENILENLKKNPDKKCIIMDVNDLGGYCQCERCLKIVNGKRNSIGKLDYSEIYWKWVNEVAKEVSKTHPDLIFRGIAYTEVLEPPSFHLHKNVVPVICMELIAMLDSKVGPVRRKMLDRWTEKASRLGMYDYCYGGERFYLLPRVYLRNHSRLHKEMIKKHNLRFVYFESDAQTAAEGPKQQLFYRLCWNPDLDVDEFLKQYYIDCVGGKAAPYLDKYYTFWENYWTGSDIRETQWYRTVSSVYMHLGERSTHTYALKKGDLKYARSLLEKVVALADTPDQKRRAKAIMQSYDLCELAATAVFGEIISPDGKIHNAKQAAELLQAVPTAVKALELYQRHPLVGYSYDKGKNLASACFGTLGKVYCFVKDPAVTAELRKLADRKELPLNLQGQIKIMLGAKPVNLIANGDMEKTDLPLIPIWSKTLPGKTDTTHVSSGKYAYRMQNGSFVIRSGIEPGKTYMFLFDVYIQKAEVEGRINFQLAEYKGNVINVIGWLRILNQIPTGGIWNTYSATFTGNPGSDSVQIVFWTRNFENDNPIWIDNFRLYCLDDMK